MNERDPVLAKLDNIQETMSQVRERLAGQETSTKGLWHETRDLGKDLKEQVRALPEAVAAGVSRHEISCPAREAAVLKLRNDKRSVPPQAAQAGPRGDEMTGPAQASAMSLGGDSVGLTVPRPVLWAGCLLGVAIAVAVIVLKVVGYL
jgi:hypothetical protein